VNTEQSLPQLDTVLLQEYLDSLGKNIVEKMFALYCQQVVIYLNDIEKALLNDSEQGWQEHCHKMKGASASVGLIRLHGQLKQLENTDAQQQEKSLMLEELKLANKQAISDFNHWLVAK